MDILKEARQQINEIDAEMAELFVRRMRAVETVAEYKRANGLPILDAAREASLINNNAQRIEDETLRAYYVSFLQRTIELSREYQKELLKKN